MSRGRAFRDGIVVIGFLVLSVLATWPLARNVDRAVSDPGDPYLNTFILDWNYTALRSGRALFDAPIFHPARNTLAFSENLFGQALLAAPLRACGLSALTAYNLVLLIGLALTGFGAFVLVRGATGSMSAGLLAGVIYMLVPWRFVQLSHLQHIWSGFLPLALWALLRVAARPSLARGAVLLVTTVLLGATNLHWLILGGTALGLIAIVLGALTRASRRYWMASLGALALALVVLLPLLLPYFAVAREYQAARTEEETLRYSATPRDWLTIPPALRIYARATPATDPELWLFPGSVAIALAVLGLLLRRRQTTDAGSIAEYLDRQRLPLLTIVLGLWIVLGFWGSLGLHGWLHSTLFDSVGAFRGIRAPARWANLAYLGIAALAGAAIASVVRARWRHGVAFLALLLVLAETRVAPLRWYLGTDEHLPVYRWLATMPSEATVLELPMAEGSVEYEYVLASTRHHRPIANGVSGFAPPLYDRLAALTHAEPMPASLPDELEAAGIRLLLVHADLLAGRGPSTTAFLRSAISAGRLRPLRHFDNRLQGDFVFQIVPRRRAPDAADRTLAAQAVIDPHDRITQWLQGGGVLYSDAIQGMLDTPQPREEIVGPLRVSGWAISPHGVREVLVHLHNGGETRRATLAPNPGLGRVYPWYAHHAAGFVLDVPATARGWRATDVQVEIVDRRGRRRFLAPHWITWRRTATP